jgi:hypothetical protein
MTKEFIGAAAAVIGLLGYVPYFHGLWRGTVRPHVFTWFLWGVLMGIIYAIQVVKGAGPGAWMMGISALFCLIIAAAAFRQGDKSITRFDWTCFVLGLLTLPLWYLTEDPLYSVLLMGAIDILALSPTLRKSWVRPHEESAATYAISGVKTTLSLFAIENRVLATVFYPALISVLNSLLVGIILWRRHALRKI